MLSLSRTINYRKSFDLKKGAGILFVLLTIGLWITCGRMDQGKFTQKIATLHNEQGCEPTLREIRKGRDGGQELSSLVLLTEAACFAEANDVKAARNSMKQVMERKEPNIGLGIYYLLEDLIRRKKKKVAKIIFEYPGVKEVCVYSDAISERLYKKGKHL